VSRRTFYEIFEDREDCFLAAFDGAIARIASEVVPAYEQPGRWREKVRAGLIALLSVFDSDPGVARLVVVESLGGGARALERRRRVVEALISVVDEGRGEAVRETGLTRLTAEGVVGALLAIVHARLLEEHPGRLAELSGSLMGIVVLPYLGQAVARAESARPVPKAVGGRGSRGAPDPLRHLEMRLTYRTVRVLLAVASNPGSSNRAVADVAGIVDQGQISKLLARLHGLGLIENTGAGATRGERNAWRLTRKGEEVHDAIAGQSTAAR
jgi:AcrR family transcriptional regulator/DNA-binding MarR family transcriptional regulator